MHRHTGVGTPALPPDRTAPTEARYHRAGEPWPLYASLEPATAWAEWQAATRGAIDPATERRRLWRIDVNDLPVVDLRDPAVRAALDVEVERLVRGRRASQQLAGRARALGARGIVAPSAALDGAWNLVVFPTGFSNVRPSGSRVANPAPPRRSEAGPA